MRSQAGHALLGALFEGCMRDFSRGMGAPQGGGFLGNQKSALNTYGRGASCIRTSWLAWLGWLLAWLGLASLVLSALAPRYWPIGLACSTMIPTMFPANY